jgi:hypothetical protein
MKDIKPNQLVYVKEGEGIVRTVEFVGAKERYRNKCRADDTTPHSHFGTEFTV